MATEALAAPVPSVPLHTTTNDSPLHPPTELPARMAKEKQKLDFNALSKEIKELVLSNVLRPTDLKNVCLANKELHEIAVRFLYRKISLDLGSANDNRLSAFLSPNNIGLKHIKQLRLYLATVYDKCNQEQQAQFATRMILEFLPEDTLEEFSWCPWKPFSTDNLILLYKKQRKMKWLECMDLDRNFLPELKKNSKLQSNIFNPTARRLALYPENRETLDLSGFFVEKVKDQLEELIVHCQFPLDAGDERELNDTATAPGLISRTIFGSSLATGHIFPKLRELRLHRVNLRHCADWICPKVDFHNMVHLRVCDCPGADSFLGQLGKANHLPKQLRTLELQHRDNSENEALVALDGFLCLVSGIRDLVIDLENVKALPAAAGIAHHSKTLEMLVVHCSPDGRSNSISTTDSSNSDELVWSLEDFDKICACENLEQLSCAWPHTSLIRNTSDEWLLFEHSLQRLRNLVTLHITTWPSNKPSTQSLPRDVYETLLQSLAQREFEVAWGSHLDFPPPPPPTSLSSAFENAIGEEDALAMPVESGSRSKLRIIAFGTSDKIHAREDSRHQFIYLRSTCQDASGKSRPYAAPIGWCLRQFVEPKSDVLDCALHQSTKPPCRDHRDTTVWGEEDDFDNV